MQNQGKAIFSSENEQNSIQEWQKKVAEFDAQIKNKNADGIFKHFMLNNRFYKKMNRSDIIAYRKASQELQQSIRSYLTLSMIGTGFLNFYFYKQMTNKPIWMIAATLGFVQLSFPILITNIGTKLFQSKNITFMSGIKEKYNFQYVDFVEANNEFKEKIAQAYEILRRDQSWKKL